MRIDNPYSYRNYLGRCTSRDENGNAEIEGLDMTFLLGLHYEEQKLVQQALNRLADFEDAEEAADMNDNQPLSWDELLMMEGMPVWLEVYDPIDGMTGWRTASWRLIEFINDEYFDVRNSDGEQECFYKSESKYWTVYRKERTDAEEG